MNGYGAFGHGIAMALSGISLILVCILYRALRERKKGCIHGGMLCIFGGVNCDATLVDGAALLGKSALVTGITAALGSV